MSQCNFQIIIIAGYPHHGKSEFVKQCKEYPGYEVVELSTVDWPKQVAAYCGYDGSDKNEKYRRFLNEIKNALENMDGSPSNKVIENIRVFQEYNVKNYIFFVNIREARRISEFKEKVLAAFGINCTTLFINNPNEPRILTNYADRRVKDYNYDYYITNDGTLNDLKAKAFYFLDIITRKDKNDES